MPQQRGVFQTRALTPSFSMITVVSACATISLLRSTDLFFPKKRHAKQSFADPSNSQSDFVGSTKRKVFVLHERFNGIFFDDDRRFRLCYHTLVEVDKPFLFEEKLYQKKNANSDECFDSVFFDDDRCLCLCHHSLVDFHQHRVVVQDALARQVAHRQVHRSLRAERGQ